MQGKFLSLNFQIKDTDTITFLILLEVSTNSIHITRRGLTFG